MTREVLSITIPLLGGLAIRIQHVTERYSAPPPRKPSIDVAGVTLPATGPALVRAAVARLVPFHRAA